MPDKRRDLKARIGAHEQLDRPDGGVDRAEPQPLGLTLRAAELACGIDFHLDAIVGRLLQLRLVNLDVFVLHVVDCLGRELHREILRPRRAGSEKETCNDGDRRGREAAPRDFAGSIKRHVFSPSLHIIVAMDASRFAGSNSTVKRSRLEWQGGVAEGVARRGHRWMANYAPIGRRFAPARCADAPCGEQRWRKQP